MTYHATWADVALSVSPAIGIGIILIAFGVVLSIIISKLDDPKPKDQPNDPKTDH